MKRVTYAGRGELNNGLGVCFKATQEMVQTAGLLGFLTTRAMNHALGEFGEILGAEGSNIDLVEPFAVDCAESVLEIDSELRTF